MNADSLNDRELVKSCFDKMLKWECDGVAPDDAVTLVDYINDEVISLAERLGMANEQFKLQELVVKLGFPEDYRRIKKLRLESEMSCEMVFNTFALPIRAMLDDMGIEYEFKFRMKSIYSIWRKMVRDNKFFDDVYDLFATRIVYKPKPTIEPLPMASLNEVDCLEEVKQASSMQLSEMDVEKFYCWRIYTVISMLYRIRPDRIRNWISKPKPSGYQALQITVMGPDCNWIELQIRSERMDYEAENGVAAHWKYKSNE